MTPKTPERVVGDLDDAHLIDAVESCEAFRRDGISEDDSFLRQLADELSHLPVDAGTRLEMVSSAVFREAALRWHVSKEPF